MIKKNIILGLILSGSTFSLYSDFDAQYNEEREHMEDRVVTDEELLRNAITKALRVRGFETRPGRQQISVSLNNGDVTLYGLVNTWEEKYDIENAILKIKGVTNLESQIRVRSQGYIEDSDEYSQDPYRFTDQVLRDKVLTLLKEGWFNRGYQNINVEIYRGYITLKGTVETWDDKIDIDEAIRRMKEIRGLNNQLYVIGKKFIEEDYNPFPQDEYTSAKDQYITKEVRKKIASGWLWGDNQIDIQVNTERGVVTLEGTVRSRVDEQKIISEIKRIPGVHLVYSHLQISKQD